MNTETAKVPFRSAKLIIGWLHNNLSSEEQSELDNWINASDDNMHLFEELTHDVDHTVFDPNQLMLETEDATELWIIAGLIVRSHQKFNDTMEQKYLDEWIAASPGNKALFDQLRHPAFMQKMVVWARLNKKPDSN